MSVDRGSGWSSAARALVLALAVPVIIGCAAITGSPGPAEMLVDCDALDGDTLDAVMVSAADMPTLTNRAAVRERLEWLEPDGEGLRARVQLLVQPNGRVSHGCVPESSGDSNFDRAALEAAREARFQPGTRAGRPVPVWVTFRIGLD